MEIAKAEKEFEASEEKRTVVNLRVGLCSVVSFSVTEILAGSDLDAPRHEDDDIAADVEHGDWKGSL